MISAEKKIAHQLLPVADLLLLNRFNGRLAGEELSPYDVEEYGAKSYVFETRLWSELDKLKTALNLTDQELIKLFEGAAKTAIKPPFSYFEVDTMAEIILERLNGQADLLKRYEKYSKKPRENASEYVYYKIY